MKISILAPDLSHNCLGRAYLLAKALQEHYMVEVVGPLLGDKIWGPVANDRGIKYKFVRLSNGLKVYWQFKRLLEIIEGDVIYASKPLFTSFGIGLLKKKLDKKKLVLDIDDWQMGFIKWRYSSLNVSQRLKFLSASLLKPYSVSSYWNNLFGENMLRFVEIFAVI